MLTTGRLDHDEIKSNNLEEAYKNTPEAQYSAGIKKTSMDFDKSEAFIFPTLFNNDFKDDYID